MPLSISGQIGWYLCDPDGHCYLTMDVCPTCMINVTVNVRTDHVTKVWLCSLGDFELQTKFAKFMTG